MVKLPVMHERKEKHKGVQCNYNQTVWHAFVPHACLCVSCAFVYALRNVFILCSVCITVIPEWRRVSVLCRGLVQPCQCECRGLTAFTARLCMCVCGGVVFGSAVGHLMVIHLHVCKCHLYFGDKIPSKKYLHSH